MCRHGTDVEVRVLMPADLHHSGVATWETKKIDACIAPIVRALTEAGIYTSSCCCGHGREEGEIRLHDGRVLAISKCSDCLGTGYVRAPMHSIERRMFPSDDGCGLYICRCCRQDMPRER